MNIIVVNQKIELYSFCLKIFKWTGGELSGLSELNGLSGLDRSKNDRRLQIKDG